MKKTKQKKKQELENDIFGMLIVNQTFRKLNLLMAN